MNLYLKTGWNDWYRRRVPGVFLFLLAAFCILFLRLFQLQVLGGAQYHRLSENNAIRLQALAPHRGLILDANGYILAENRPSFDVCVVPWYARRSETVLPLLAEILSIDGDKLADKVAQGRRSAPYTPVCARQDIDRDLLAVIHARLPDLPGVILNVQSQRHYPQAGTPAHLVGYVGQISPQELSSGRYPHRRSGDFVGKYGVEKAFEAQISGRYGGRQVEMDAKGQVVSVLRTVPAEPGNNIHLTLDLRLQNRAKQLMGDNTGAVVAVDITTGGILAMVSQPEFNPNWFADGMSAEQWNFLAQDPARPLENKALLAYPPGSVYKIVSAMAGLEEGVITPQSTFFCSGSLEFGGREFRCWRKGGHGRLALVAALAQSCDVYFYELGLLLGVDRLAWYAHACGLGSVTGLGLDSESSGLVATAAWKRSRFNEAWMPGETLSVVIGQGFNLTTPLQMAMLSAAVANGGILHKPQVVARVLTPQGETVEAFAPKVRGRLPVSPQNLEIIKQGLFGAVNNPAGTARASRLSTVPFSGKTGTAQVVGRGDRETFLNRIYDRRDFQNHAWFTGYFVEEDGAGIAVAVFVEHGGGGAAVAAPIARDIIAEYALQDRPLMSGRADAVGSRE
ncbi:MAG: penicillin-binding protein 2 [Desulfatibacillaceae bacterium]|nr:penicillin-binding protein 2 [Desulfatibacillaceae bacterium]